MWRVEATGVSESVYVSLAREHKIRAPARGIGAGETADVRRAFEGAFGAAGRGTGIRSRPSPGPAGASRGGLGVAPGPLAPGRARRVGRCARYLSKGL